ncbi:MAG: nitroreductase family protein [Acidimicrobiales bacterium]
MDTLDAIAARRSIGRLVEPGPTPAHLRSILEAAACAPDHGELRPFRFTVLEGVAKECFGHVLEEAYRARCEIEGVAVEEAKATKDRTKLGRAPTVVIVAAARQEGGSSKMQIPMIEQVAATAAACQNALLAATALGYGSMWRTGDCCYDEPVKAALGLSERDAIVGFLYLGSATPEAAAAKPPKVADLEGLVTHWSPS